MDIRVSWGIVQVQDDVLGRRTSVIDVVRRAQLQ